MVGKYLTGDHPEGAGDVQKLDDSDSDELREELDDESSDGRENLEIEVCEGVAISFGDFSTIGSRDEGELKRRHTVFGMKPMARLMHTECVQR